MFEANEYYANPEMLLASRYPACFDRVLNLVVKRVKSRETSVNLKINIKQIEKLFLIGTKYSRSKPRKSPRFDRNGTLRVSIF
ncbi:hypothetical protein FLGE108171_05655 [Flavobacterium gelidilacus]|uniref:hypothetical protein n=1 Tax=Flavobacterium gelidilacus TaxID=206041 RepID=UPI000412DD11|nr:hypothetical protein [Flavobacterium gelidilacus]